MRQRTPVRPVSACIAVLLVLTAGCKSGNPLSSGIEPALAGFVADSPPAELTERYITLEEGVKSESRVFVDVVVHEVDEPVTGIAVKLTYPSSIAKFVSCADGTLFPPGTCYFAEPEPGSGEVFIGRSIGAPGEATEVAGDQVVVRAQFLVFAQGQGGIEIEGQNLGGGDASALLDAEGDPIFMQWFSGTLVGE